MKKVISSMIICFLLISTVASAIAFTDIDNSDYISEIAELTELGIISGFEDSTFKPKDNVTRAQAAKMFAVVRGFTGKPVDYYGLTQRIVFLDFDSSHWAFKYADYLMPESFYVDGNGNEIPAVRVIDGFEDGTFRPDDNITIVQLLKMAICCLGDDGYYKEANNNGGYPDGYIETAKTYGISDGIDMNDINVYVTREQAAKIISNTINLPLKLNLTCNDISDNHEIIKKEVTVTYDGMNEHFPLTTLKSMLKSGDWSEKITVNLSPFDNENVFFAYGVIDSISDSEITIIPSGIINTDGSIYNVFDKIKVTNNDFDFKVDDTYYYFKFQRQNNGWVIVNYAIVK